MAKHYPIWGLRTALLGLALLALAGCQFLNFLSQEQLNQEIPRVKPETKSSFRLPPYIFVCDFQVDPKSPTFRELEQLREQVCQELSLTPSDKNIQVYLFQTKAAYEKHINAAYPSLPPRRAFFVAQPRSQTPGAKTPADEDLMVFTYWGKQVQEDLRHELTHALLHSDLKDVPLWLDEGLAEYFEVPRTWSGVNPQHLDNLPVSTDPSYRPDMARLEKITQVQNMNSAEYREAWAWTHWMIRGHPRAKQILIAYLQELRKNPNPGPLEPRLRAAIPDMDSLLVQHIRNLTADPNNANLDRSP
jgi:hypothetical protein